MRIHAKKLMILALVLPLAGCLLSTTKTFEYDVLENHNFGQPISVDVDQGTSLGAVDLTTNSTYNDNKDKIKLVDRVGFRAALDNEGGSATRLSIYFDQKNEADSVDLDEATLILEGFPVPAGTSTMSYAQSEEYIRNFTPLQQAVEKGKLRLIAVSTGSTEFDLTKLILVITMTVG